MCRIMGFTGETEPACSATTVSIPGTAQAWVLPDEPGPPVVVPGRPHVDARAAQTGFYGEWASRTEPQSNNYMGNYNFGHNAQNPLSTGNGYAERAPRRVHDLHRAHQPRRSGSPALAD